MAAIRARLDEFNLIASLNGLAKNRVPMFAVHGDNDAVVPHEENTRLLQKHYEKLGGQIEVKLIPGGGHEVTPAFFECQELVDFILRHAAP